MAFLTPIDHIDHGSAKLFALSFFVDTVTCHGFMVTNL
jgi:hypothetical protein